MTIVINARHPVSRFFYVMPLGQKTYTSLISFDAGDARLSHFIDSPNPGLREGSAIVSMKHGTSPRPRVCRATYPEIRGQSTEKSFQRASINIEDDEETTLLPGQSLNSWRRPWQHDNPFIRLPSHFIRYLWHNPQVFWYLGTVALCGGLLEQIVEGRFPSLMLVLCSMNIICLATYSRFQAEEGDGAI